MYLIPICVPVFRDGPRQLVATDWKRALELLRDSLGGRYGDLRVLSPWLPADGSRGREQDLEPFEPGAGVSFVETHDERARPLHYWTRSVGPYRRLLERELRSAAVVHSGLDELYRPMMTIAFWMAVRRGIPTVFVQDTDEVVQVPQLARGLRRRVQAKLYVSAYERLCRRAVASADLSLLKGDSLMERYAGWARNARRIEDTSYRESEIVGRERVEQRLRSLSEPRPLRLVYCGRMVARKGLERSIELLRLARERGARISLDLIGGGPEEDRLRRAVESAGLESQVSFCGVRPYDAALLAHLAQFDALLFTPSAEDTPRMIFDGYAAALPLIASGIPYVLQRAREERATLVLPQDDAQAGARLLAELDAQRGRLVELSWAAHAAARYHCAEAWYERRAQWTHEAVERRRALAPALPPRSSS